MKIETRQIEVEMNKNPILKGIDLTAPSKTFIGIIGPNGSGKSTLLKCLYRVLKPDAGAVFLDGQALYKMTPKQSAKKVAVVAQHNYYSFDFSVEEIVLMGRSPHKRNMESDHAGDYEVVRQSLRKVGMEAFAKRQFTTLSGGEQQRIILARALAQETPCMILDEPTNHLDIKYQLQLMDIVKALDVTVIAAIHDLNIAAMYCDKIYGIKAGEVVAYGTPNEVLTEDFIKEVYDVEAQIIKDSQTGLMHILYKPAHV